MIDLTKIRAMYKTMALAVYDDSDTIVAVTAKLCTLIPELCDEIERLRGELDERDQTISDLEGEIWQLTE